MLHVTFLTLLRALEVSIELRHVNHIPFYYYYYLYMRICVNFSTVYNDTLVVKGLRFFFLVEYPWVWTINQG